MAAARGNRSRRERGGARALRRTVALALIATWAIVASPASTAPAETVEQATARLAAAVKDGKCDIAAPLGRTLIATPELPEDTTAWIYLVLVLCEVEAHNSQEALALAVRGTALASAADELWHLRFYLQLSHKDLPAAIGTLEALEKASGAALSAIKMDLIYELKRLLKDAPASLRRRFLLVMTNPAYDPPDLMGNKDAFAEELAHMHVAAGELDEARRLLATLRSPQWIGRAQIDPRLRGVFEAPADIRAVAERELAYYRSQMSLMPDRLRPVMEAAALLRMLNRPDEALTIVTRARNRATRDEDYVDQQDTLAWIHNELASIHRQLGDYDGMVAALRAGGEVQEGSGANVSQIINLASAQDVFGRSADALETIAVIDREKRSVSGYGRMLTERVQLCALAQLQRMDEARTHLAYIRAHVKDAPAVLAEAQLCLGDLDGAAAAFIARLDDPEQRVEALIDAADYDDPKFPAPDTPAKRNGEEMLERPDVKAALERAGGKPRFNLQFL